MCHFINLSVGRLVVCVCFFLLRLSISQLGPNVRGLDSVGWLVDGLGVELTDDSSSSAMVGPSSPSEQHRPSQAVKESQHLVGLKFRMAFTIDQKHWPNPSQRQS